MLYPQEIVEEVRINNDIIDVVSEYVTLKRTGGYYKGLCPFHHEKTPSFTVTADKQIFHCFGCGASGNVLSFIMKIENLDFVEALKQLADRARIALPEPTDTGEYQQRADHIQNLLQINTESARYFYYYLNSTKGLEGMQYLKHRNLTQDTIKKFGIGYVGGEEWDNLLKHLTEKGFTTEHIAELGLILPRKQSQGFYDRFRSRVIFPIFDIRKKIVGFGGRIIGDGEPKYLNSPESILFNKSKNLYGFHLAKNTKAEHILIVEGYMDVIALHQAGFDQAVASLGTALTLDQAKLLKKYTKEVVLCYDNDEAGRNAALRGMDILAAIGLKVKVLTIPDGKDPDEFIKKYGAEEFENLLNLAVYFVEYKINLLREKYNLNDVEEKVSFLKEFVRIVSKLDNQMEADAYIKLVSEKTKISVDAIYNEINKQVSNQIEKKNITANNINKQIIKNKSTSRNQQSTTNSPNKALMDAQKQILYILATDLYVYNQIKECIDLKQFTDEGLESIAKEIFSKLEQKEKVIPAELINHFNSIEMQQLAASIFQQDIHYDNLEKEKAINDMLKTLRLHELYTLQKKYMQALDMHAFQGISQQISEIQQGKSYITIYERKDHS